MPKKSNPNATHKNVRFEIATYNRLKQHGVFDDTIGDVVNRLMDKVEKQEQQAKIKEI